MTNNDGLEESTLGAGADSWDRRGVAGASVRRPRERRLGASCAVKETDTER